MKRLLALLIVAATAVQSTCFSGSPVRTTYWVVANGTDTVLRIEVEQTGERTEFELQPAAEATLHKVNNTCRIGELWLYEGVKTVMIYSTTGAALRRWSSDDIVSGRQFFNADYWTSHENYYNDSSGGEAENRYVFIVGNQDIEEAAT